MTTDHQAASARLQAYIEKQDFAGYDPYDALNSPIPFARLGILPASVAIQIMKRLPLNVRPALGIRKGHNPKGLGLCLHALSLGGPKNEATCRRLFEMLLELRSSGFSGDCWGYNFDWASPGKLIPAFAPTGVVTAFVARGIRAYHEAFGDPEAAASLERVSRFVFNDLPRTELETGTVISYSPLKPDRCLNASLLAAELLAPTEHRTAQNAVEYALNTQRADGSWSYSVNPETGAERNQIDFHQGYVVESLLNLKTALELNDPRLDDAILRGAQFYRDQQFTPDGRSYWRLPKRWPTDIHHQAQGIITFARLPDPALHEFAASIADWTIRHMQRTDGAFIYRKGRVVDNRIPFMRWGQAWMLLALATLAERR